MKLYEGEKRKFVAKINTTKTDVKEPDVIAGEKAADIFFDHLRKLPAGKRLLQRLSKK